VIGAGPTAGGARRPRRHGVRHRLARDGTRA
jgi:hypothetical protein